MARKAPKIEDVELEWGRDVDLEADEVTLSSGRRLTDEVIDEFVEAAHAIPVGRPSLTAPGRHSPTVTVRLPEQLNERLAAESELTGIRRSDIVRRALEEHLGV